MQVFYDRRRLEREPVLGALGMLQFEVFRYRLRAEYGVEVRLERLAFVRARWVEGEAFDADEVERKSGVTCLLDAEGRPLVLFASDFRLQRTIEDFPEIKFLASVQPSRRARRAA